MRAVHAHGHVLHQLGLRRLVLLRGAHQRVLLRAGLGPRGLCNVELRDGVLSRRAHHHGVIEL